MVSFFTVPRGLSKGYICSNEELQFANSNTTTLVCLSRGQSIGLAIVVVSSCISIAAASGVLLLISCRAYKRRSFEPILIFLTSLFVAELLMGVGNAMDLKWVVAGKLETGGFCTAQGVIKQSGEMAVALATLLIAVLNFVTIWWTKKATSRMAIMITSVQWLFVVLFVVVGFLIHTHPPKEYFASPVPFWCWLGGRYGAERIAGEYIWFWLALVGSFLSYLPLFLWYLGLIDPDSPCWYKPSTGKQRPPLSSTIWYPVVVCIMILPVSVVRCLTFKYDEKGGPHSFVPDAVTIASFCPFTLSGALNALLYILTRRQLLWGPSIPEKNDSVALALFPKAVSDV